MGGKYPALSPGARWGPGGDEIPPWQPGAALPVERAIAEIEAFSGRQFDPVIATAFVAMIREVDAV